MKELFSTFFVILFSTGLATELFMYFRVVPNTLRYIGSSAGSRYLNKERLMFSFGLSYSGLWKYFIGTFIVVLLIKTFFTWPSFNANYLIALPAGLIGLYGVVGLNFWYYKNREVQTYGNTWCVSKKLKEEDHDSLG